MGPSADPNAPATTFQFREHFRGTVGYPIPLLARGSFRLTLPALVELHDAWNRSLFPSQLWRGRAGLSLSWARAFETGSPHTPPRPLWLTAVALLEHESNHITASRDLARTPTYLYLDSVGAKLGVALPRTRATIASSITARLHVLTCTRLDAGCPGADAHGAQTFEGTVDGVIEAGRHQSGVRSLAWFLAIHAGYLAPTHRIARELRLVAHTGLRLRRPHLGRTEIFLVTLLGNDVGYFRAQTEYQIGVGIRYRP